MSAQPTLGQVVKALALNELGVTPVAHCLFPNGELRIDLPHDARLTLPKRAWAPGGRMCAGLVECVGEKHCPRRIKCYD